MLFEAVYLSKNKEILIHYKCICRQRAMPSLIALIIEKDYYDSIDDLSGYEK